METATQQANDPGYLDRHWRQVVARHEADGRIDIAGLGVGLDLSGVFRRSRVMDLDGAVRNRLFADLLALLARPRARRG
jgi:cobaltochelatase CobT